MDLRRKLSLGPLGITGRHLRRVLPVADKELDHWRGRAAAIPDPSLRSQALASIDTKAFHCHGGSVFAGWEKPPSVSVARFIVAFQTISDYLDNLCDRTDSLSEVDFRRLHDSMFDAVSLDPLGDGAYYAHHPHSDDGGYLVSLVHTCRTCIDGMPRFHMVAPEVRRIVSLYVDLQVYKHLPPSERVGRLTAWFERQGGMRDGEHLSWWEFAAASGSTLAVFALISEAAKERPVEDLDALISAYFPWICGLHILLDYFIDQEEDRLEGDLNFVSFYPDRAQMKRRLSGVLRRAQEGVGRLSDGSFHQAVVEGLLGLYLSDPKVHAQEGLDEIAFTLIQTAGWRARLVYYSCLAWRRGRNKKQRAKATI